MTLRSPFEPRKVLCSDECALKVKLRTISACFKFFAAMKSKDKYWKKLIEALEATNDPTDLTLSNCSSVLACMIEHQVLSAKDDALMREALLELEKLRTVKDKITTCVVKSNRTKRAYLYVKQKQAASA